MRATKNVQQAIHRIDAYLLDDAIIKVVEQKQAGQIPAAC